MELKEDMIAKIRDMGSEVRFNMGDVIYREGEKADQVHVIVSGHASIFKKSLSGEDVFIGLAGAGSIIGEMGLFLEGERTATVRASSNVTAIVFDADKFLEAVSKIPEISYMMLKEFSKRVNNLNRRIINITTSKLIYVIGIYLLENLQLEESPYYTPEEGTVQLYIKKFSIEHNMELSRVESVLNALAKPGIIRIENTQNIQEEGKEDTLYTIKLNPDKLRSYLRSIAHV